MQTDVIILGDGIAGLSSAIAARQKELRTIVLSSTSKPKDEFHVVLHPGVEPLFNMLGLAQNVANLADARPEGYWRCSPQDNEFVSYGQDTAGRWLGYVVNLGQLENLFRARAHDLGVDFAGPISEVHAHTTNGAVKGLDSSGKYWRASLTIDASGGRGGLARKMGLKCLYGSPPLIATYATQKAIDTNSFPVFWTQPDGWHFDIRTGAGRKSTIRLVLTKHKICTRNKFGRDVSWPISARLCGAGIRNRRRCRISP